MKVEIHDAASEEAAGFVRWYSTRDVRTGKRLAELFVAAIVQISRRPLTFPRMEGTPEELQLR